jgi:hypothetical protein
VKRCALREDHPSFLSPKYLIVVHNATGRHDPALEEVRDWGIDVLLLAIEDEDWDCGVTGNWALLAFRRLGSWLIFPRSCRLCLVRGGRLVLSEACPQSLMGLRANDL